MCWCCDSQATCPGDRWYRYKKDGSNCYGSTVRLPINSVGFFSMKCSQSLMNVSVVSFEGLSPWLKQNRGSLDLLHNYITQFVQLMTAAPLLPFTLKFHIFYALCLDVFAVVKASSVRQIHKQTHFHLETDTAEHVIHFPVSESEFKSWWSYLLLGFLRSWTAFPDWTCSPLQLGHRIWGPT